METRRLSDLTDDEFIANCRERGELTLAAMVEFERREDRLRELAPDLASQVDDSRRELAKAFDGIRGVLDTKFKPLGDMSALLHNRFAEMGQQLGQQLRVAKAFDFPKIAMRESSGLDIPPYVLPRKPADIDAQDTADAAAFTAVVLTDLYQLIEKSVAAQEAIVSHTVATSRTTRLYNLAILAVAILSLLVALLALVKQQ
jgi:hypothetical protein